MRHCAVIVVYSAQVTITNQLIKDLIQQDAHCIIVDNSPSPLQSYLILPQGNTDYIAFGENRGIACAQNVGLAHALALNFERIFLFDQDSQVPADFIDNMTNALRVLNQDSATTFAALGPSIHCLHTDTVEKPLVQRRLNAVSSTISEVSQIIASGMLLEASALSEVGLHDESLFIDGVDHEWCWRARQSGFKIGLASHIKLYHRLGDSRVRLMGKNIKIGHPIRLYYQTRNLVLLTSRGYVPTYWKVRNWCYLPVKLLINTFLVTAGRERAKNMWHGFWDGILGRSGPKPSNK